MQKSNSTSLNPASLIDDLLEKQAVSLSELEKSIDELRVKINSVICPSETCRPDTSPQPERPLSPLAGIIRDRNNHIAHLCQKMGDIKSSLQI